MRPFLCSTEMTIPSSRPAERQSAAHRRCPGCRHAAPAKPAQSVLHSAEHGATIRPPKGRGVTAPQSRFDKTVGGPTARFPSLAVGVVIVVVAVVAVAVVALAKTRLLAVRPEFEQA